MLATFSEKMRQWGEMLASSLLGLCYFRFFGRPGPLLAQFGLDFGGFGFRCWSFWASILEVSGNQLGPMCSLFGCSVFRTLTGNLRAGGVTRSAKNFSLCVSSLTQLRPRFLCSWQHTARLVTTSQHNRDLCTSIELSANIGVQVFPEHAICTDDVVMSRKSSLHKHIDKQKN